MKYSWNWLQDYVDLSDYARAELGELMSLRALEVEEVTDEYIDIDVTPNRGADCLSHWGIANEFGAILNRAVKQPWSSDKMSEYEMGQVDQEFVNQFSVAVIKNVKVEKSPDWIIDRLKTVGLKPINVLVDLTNYVMLDFGQPMHAYDLDKLPSDQLGVRVAKEGEKIELLDGQIYELIADNYVIADSDDKPLGLAGVKGGVSSSITDSATSILVEAANFDPTKTRRSGAVLGIRTDALKRFENNLANDWAEYGINRYIELLKKIQPNIEPVKKASLKPNYYSGADKNINFSISKLNQLLGTNLTKTEIKNLLNPLAQVCLQSGDEDIIIIEEPVFYRKDLNIFQDYVEEIGRLIGYENIDSQLLPKLEITSSEYDLYTAIRNTLTEFGLSEVHTYSLVKKGDIATLKPLASDKGSLRTNISTQLADSMAMNTRNAELFGQDRVGIFEIGSVFPKSGEEKHLAIALSGQPKISTKIFEEIKQALSEISDQLVQDWKIESIPGGSTVEISLKGIIYNTRVNIPISSDATFGQFSTQPFITRDISVWLDGGDQNAFENVIKNNAGDHLLSYRLIDQFEKDGRQSVAYRLVFQAFDKTLTDEVINVAMERIYQSLGDKYELR